MTDNLPPLPEPAEKANDGVCCGNFTTGGEYLGQSETLCCGQPDERWPDYYTAEQMQSYARAALAQAQSCVPDGWAVVPPIPDDAMLEAFAVQVSPETDWHGSSEAERQEVRDGFNPAYAAMIAASPQPQPVQPTTDAALHEVRAHLSHINRLLEDAVPIAQAKPEQAAQPTQNECIQYLKDIHGFLESTCPKGFADEVFRLPPSPTRSQELLLHAIKGDADGKPMGLERQDSGHRPED